MRKLFLPLLTLCLLAGTSVLQSCDSDDDAFAPNYEPPTLSLKLNSVERTEADFTIRSNDGVDYAYIVAEKGESPVTDAKEIFANGQTGLLEDGVANITTNAIEGGKEYVVYAAVRKINPYTYSEVTMTDLSTDIPYTNIVTLDKVGLTDIKYHVEVPAGAKKVKHIVVKEADYIGIRNILGSISEVTEDLYLKVFGHLTEENTDMTLDKLAYNALDTHIQIHTGTTYYLMGGVVGDDGEIDKETFECIKFDTRKAEKSPYKIGVTVEPSNTSTKVFVNPDPEIVEYRILVETRAEFDYALAEGEAQMRNLIVGFWDDSRNSPKRLYTGAREFNTTAMIPNTEYVVGIIGYDVQRRETLVRYDFVTGEPTGPAPTIEITDVATSSPWSSKAYNVKVSGAEEVIYGYFLKSSVDKLIFNGSSIQNIISLNGTICDASTMIAVSSPEGAVFETSTLDPLTEYTFGVYARSNEYVVAVAYESFTTEEMAQTGGAVRKNMPGNYTATTTDFDGNTVTFPVTITTGVNESTTNEYAAQNRLVALGFGPSAQFPYCSPETLIASGSSAEDANNFYGPKWFFEFSDDGVTVPGCNKQWSVGNIDGHTTYMMGYGTRVSGSRVIEYTDENMTFDVDVSDDYNTITIHGKYHGKIAGKEIYKYPAIYYSTGSGWTASNTILFAAHSDIVLTRQGNATSGNRLHRPTAPRVTTLTVGKQSIANGREDAASRIK
ncbi:MAG: hypothetical protein NC111_07510 [Bacteroides sp.]|nr:hypothetical protein [Bacteroides sp.]MCM1414091.1 hypothetical protein [Bacteroides sp.]MCM1472355.1 hypothetical protein [Bacteroides sp.]